MRTNDDIKTQRKRIEIRTPVMEKKKKKNNNETKEK